MATEWRRTIQKKRNGIVEQRTMIQQRHIRDGDITEADPCSSCRSALLCYSKHRLIDPSEVVLRAWVFVTEVYIKAVMLSSE